LTNACELHCPFCYAPKVPGRLDAGTVISWIEELDSAGALGVGFGGGEPSAHPDFGWLCVEAARRTTMAVTFTTHGHRIGADLAATLRGAVHFIRVSMDGIGSTYERLRGRPFDLFLRQLELIATIAPFGLNVVINDETVCDLDAIASLAGRVGATEILLLPEQPVGDRPGITPAACGRLVEWVSNSAPGVRVTISEASPIDGVPLADPFPDERPLEAHVHVDAIGVLRPNAYATAGVKLGTSFLESLEALRAAMTA
jgi:MoaA/NifB/PqqE/SkfB family radical SAM enzyme